MADLVSHHYHRFMGQPVTTWINDLYPFQVCRFDDQPYEGCITYATLGMSEFPLKRPDSLEGVQEIVFIAYPAFADRHIEDLLFVVGGNVVRRGTVLLKGEILGPAGPLVRGATVEALLCSSPPYFPDDFDQIEQQPPIVMVGLVPITRDEAAYGQSHGWPLLEEQMVEEQPDLADLLRPSMNVCRT